MTVRVSHINSNVTTLVNDFDHSFVMKRAIGEVSWVLFSDLTTKPEFDLNTTTWEISIWECVIMGTRTASQPIASQKMMLRVNLYETEIMAVTNWNKIYIEIDDTLLQDQSLIEDSGASTDFALGKTIATLKSTAAYPTHPNYIKLREITWAWPTTADDVRVATRISDNAVNLPANQDFIDLWVDVTDNANSITSLLSWNVIAKKLCWETIAQYEQTFLEQRPEYADIWTETSAAFNPSNTNAAQSTKDWYKITSNCRQVITTVTKHANCTATTAFIYNDDETVQLASWNFSWNVATVNCLIEAWTDYLVLANSNWASYTQTLLGVSYPKDGDMLNYIAWWDSGVIAASTAFNITTVDSIPGEKLWDLTVNTSNSIKFIAWWTTSINAVKIWMAKIASPVDNITLRIETDTAWNPSWSLVDANATATTSWSALNSSIKTDVEFTLTWNISLVKWTVYHIVLDRDWWLDPTNYYILFSSKYHSTTRGLNLKWAGARWTEISQIPYLDIWDNTATFTRKNWEERWVLSLTDTTYLYKTTRFWQMSDAFWTIWQEKNVLVSWILPQSWLSYVRPTTTFTQSWTYKGQPYAMTTTPWAITTQALSYWNNMVWYSISPTELLTINNYWDA